MKRLRVLEFEAFGKKHNIPVQIWKHSRGYDLVQFHKDNTTTVILNTVTLKEMQDFVKNLIK